MKSAIIGANGEMAKNLLLPLIKKLGPVIEIDKGDDFKEAKKADVIWLSVPRESVSAILRNQSFKKDKLIVEICSIKRGIGKTIKKTGAELLSLHPLHGPYIPLNGQRWVEIKGKKSKKAKKIISFLKEQGITFITASSEEEHDFMLEVLLSIPELFTIVIDSLFDTYFKKKKNKKPDYKKMIEWAVPASNVLLSFYFHSIYSSSSWLRKELILGGNLMDIAKDSFKELSKMEEREIEKRIKRQKENIKNLPIDEQKRIRQLVERWYVDTTQKMFFFHKKDQMKPKIKIQYIKNKEEIFPKKNILVGIHGIEGSFTHESVLLFLEEIGINSNKINFKYLIEAKKVIDAVEKGEIERGVFCIANSGSGAYVESAIAMAERNFEVLSIYGMEILQCLISSPSIKKISEIKEVFGHPQAISQCKRTFAEKYPEIKLISGKDSDDTALCAKKIKDGLLPKTTATLASKIAGDLYGLKILEYGMHHDPFNTTTFLIIKKRDIKT